jgi:TolB-like protein/Tfp pilus assembly protein PilF
VRTLAVLPLENLSGDRRMKYFSNGMTDALITELARAPDLRVVSRMSVMQARHAQMPLRQIATKLGVDAVVEGAIVESEGRVRVTAQLIDARTDVNLWAQSFEEPMADVVGLEDKLATEIAIATRKVLVPTRGVPLGQIVPAAYEAYARGMYLLNQRDLADSVAYLRQAVALDPFSARAYAGLAEALTTDGASGGSSRPAEQAEALGAARHALQLDPESGEAFAALGLVELNYGKNWADAGRDLQRGLALDPSNSLAEMQYAIYLDAVDRPDDAVAEMRRAVQHDPRSFLMQRHLGSALYFDRQYEEALFCLQRALVLEPTRLAYVNGWVSRIDEMLHRYDAAEQTDLAQFATGISAADLRPLRSAYRRGGWKAYQAARIRLLTARPHNACDLFTVGESWLRLGDRDRAFLWLARGVEGGCYWADSLRVNPLLDQVRGDARYLELLKEARLDTTTG